MKPLKHLLERLADLLIGEAIDKPSERLAGRLS
jgi:hypothetical protein